MTSKWMGLFVTWLGWLLCMFGVHMASGVWGRVGLALLGIAVSLFGIIVLLPAAMNRNAIWKTGGSTALTAKGK